jgi:sugar (pentulose or hexulose) kinase
MAARHIAVIDIGKTNAKLALVAAEGLRELAVRKVPNEVRRDGPYPHHDVERLWDFILRSLGELNREHSIDAISVTTHGATAALVNADGELALPVLDYEHDGPDGMAAGYDAVRPAFAETGSPKLPVGLNLGAQLFWQARSFPAEFGRAAAILMYPQYWALRLTGIAAGEATSLGCHTDLWNPGAGDYSSLVDGMGWRTLMPPLRPASDRLGPILPEIAKRIGLRPDTPVVCGIHDSNASLLPHLLSREAPFAVVSTGTWVIAMAIGGKKVALDPARDSLINVNAFGDPVPSARFMGGREFEMLMGGAAPGWTETDVDRVLKERLMLLPSVQQGSGPFPGRASAWTAEPATPGERFAAASFYLAMMTATCLDLIGAAGPTIVEGPFAKNELFARMLMAATGRSVVADAVAATGTSVGAALLVLPKAQLGRAAEPLASAAPASWGEYAEVWRNAVASKV